MSPFLCSLLEWTMFFCCKRPACLLLLCVCYACSLLSQCLCFVILYDLVLSKPLNLLLARSSHSTVHLELSPTGYGPSHPVLIEVLV